MILVGLGYNKVFIPIGLFATQTLAEEALIAAGAERAVPRWSKNGTQYILITEAFQKWMEAQGLSFYSVGGACDIGNNFLFEEFPVGTISHGYDDD